MSRRVPSRLMPRTKLPVRTRANSDKHDLYERSVQCSEAELEFVDDTYKKIRGKRASSLREDFCGTAATACEWVRLRKTNTAVGVDLDGPTLASGTKRHIAKLTDEQKKRITLQQRNVLHPTGPGVGVDTVLAMNFSYWIFMSRESILAYFKAVHKSLAKDGVFFCDHYGGSDSYLEIKERRRIGGTRRGFTYVWDQNSYNPLTGIKTNYIHFEFKKGPAWKKAFTYTWRLWSLVEIRELLADAGFKNITVYWEGDDGHGSGDGVFKKTVRGEACRCYIAYISAEK